MPWRQVDPMTQRLSFVRDARQRLAPFTDLCQLYDISRTTGYKWLHRAEQSGFDYLQELSRRPHSCPHATPPALTAWLLEAHRHHPSWGPRKLLKLLRRQARRWGTEPRWPARSTVAELLRRNGVTTPRRRRHYSGHPGRPLTPRPPPCDLDGRLQGPIQTRRSPLLLPAHRAGWFQSLPARLSRPHPHHLC